MFSLVLSVAYTYGHTLTGRVNDPQGEPVAYATVVLLKADSTIAAGGMCNDKGLFTLTCEESGEYILRISFVGYKNFSQSLAITGGKDLGALTLDEDATRLAEAVVKADMVKRKADGYMFIPSGSAITTGRTSLELLNYAPGVWLSKDGKISINGRGGARVMINDRELNLSGEELAAYLESIDAEQIASIEVIPEAGAQYDASATGGILKITLKRSSVAGLIGSVGMRLAMEDREIPSSIRPTFNLDYRKDRLSLHANMAYTGNNIREDDTENTRYFFGNMRETENNTLLRKKATAYGGRIGSVYEISSRHAVGVDFDLSKGDNNSKSRGKGETRVGTDKSVIASLYNSDTDVNRYSASLSYKVKTDSKGSGLTLVTDYLYSKRVWDEYNYSSETPTVGLPIESGAIAERWSNTKLYTARTDYKRYISDKLRLEAGAKYTHTNMDTEIENEKLAGGIWQPEVDLNDHYRYKENIFAGYVNATASLNRFNLVAGLRVENTSLSSHSFIRPSESKDQDYTDFFPTARVLYFMNQKKGHMLNVGYTRSIRRPSFSELNPYKIQMDNYAYIIGNPDMEPEYSNSYSITGMLFNKYSLTLSLQDNKDVVRQIVVADPVDPNIMYYQHTNIELRCRAKHAGRTGKTVANGCGFGLPLFRKPH
jgi:outer membrane receptor protein involved in Fe transport